MFSTPPAESITLAVTSVVTLCTTVSLLTWWLSNQFHKSYLVLVSILEQHEDKDQERYESTLAELTGIKIRLAKAGIQE
jgi:hypothetical protein